jgi:activator of HSP90 ATPase
MNSGIGQKMIVSHGSRSSSTRVLKVHNNPNRLLTTYLNFLFSEVVILSGPTAGGNVGELKMIKVDKCSGEASLSRRKGKKVMLLYELEMNLRWEATIKDASGETVSTGKGSYNMPCIDTVEEIDGFEIQVKCNKDKSENEVANKYAKTEGSAKVKSIIVSVIETLKAETAQAPAPAQGSDGDSATPSSQVLTSALKAAAIDAGNTAKAHQNSGKLNGTINISTDFNAPVREVFECFTVPQRLMAFTQSKAQVRIESSRNMCTALTHGIFCFLSSVNTGWDQCWRFLLPF